MFWFFTESFFVFVFCLFLMVKWVLSWIMWPFPMAVFHSVFPWISIHVTKGKKKALGVQVSLGFAEINKVIHYIFCTFNMVIVMFQEKDVVYRISRTYLTKWFFFLFLTLFFFLFFWNFSSYSVKHILGKYTEILIFLLILYSSRPEWFWGQSWSSL